MPQQQARGGFRPQRTAHCTNRIAKGAEMCYARFAHSGQDTWVIPRTRQMLRGFVTFAELPAIVARAIISVNDDFAKGCAKVFWQAKKRLAYRVRWNSSQP